MALQFAGEDAGLLARVQPAAVRGGQQLIGLAEGHIRGRMAGEVGLSFGVEHLPGALERLAVVHEREQRLVIQRLVHGDGRNGMTEV